LWKVEAVTTLESMFEGATTFNKDITNWTVTRGASFKSMFKNAIAFNGNMFSAKQATGAIMESMFEGASAFTGKNMNNLDTFEVVNMKNMFKGATVYNSVCTTTTGSVWDVTKVTTFESMFEDARTFNKPINTWSFAATVVSGGFVSMFKNAAAFNSAIFDIDATGTGGDQTLVRSLESMFEGATAFNQLINTATGGWQVTTATTFTNMFKNAASFNQDISDWNVAAGTKFISMFEGATNFNKSVNAWTVTGMNVALSVTNMFKSATKFKQNLCSWDNELTNTATDRANMFTDTKCPVAAGTFTGNTGITAGDICCDCSVTYNPTDGCQAVTHP